MIDPRISKAKVQRRNVQFSHTEKEQAGQNLISQAGGAGGNAG